MPNPTHRLHMIRNIRLLYFHNFFTDFCPHWPFAIIYFANITGSYTAATSVLALETLAAALFDIPTGIFSDRLGRRLTMAVGSLCNALALFCYASAHGMILLYAGALLTGLSQCLFSGNNNALLYESLQAEGLEGEYHHYRGGTGSMFQMALCLSAFLSMGLSSFGLRTIFFCAVIPQIFGIIVSLLFTEPKQHMEKPAQGLHVLKQACIKTWRNPRLLGLVLAKAINYGAGESMFKSQGAFINTLWPLWLIGLSRGFMHAISFLGFRMAGRLIEHFGEPLLFVARDIYWFVAQMIALAINSVISPALILSGSFFFGPGEVASDHLMQREFSDDERATMGSISSFATSLVFALVALIIGVLSDKYGIRVGLAAATAIGFLSLPVNLWLFRKNFGVQE